MDNINRAKGNGTVSKAIAYLWYSKFRSNKMDIEGKKRSGRPREVDRVAVVNAVEAHSSMTTRMLAEDFECSHAEIVKVLPGPFPKRLLPIPIVGTLVERKKVQNDRRNAPISYNSLILRTENGRGIHQLEEQWKKVIESGGEYFDI
uniref:Mos1 transposase HTH domain-containing protein n=1 Tax=Acrobeloides nanus TaxID=290746 RepID=A0A914CEG1_9BILA